MNLRFISILTFAIALAIFLIVRATREASTEVFVPSALAAQPDMARVRVGGKVADLPINYQVEPSFELRFSIIDPGKSPTQEVKPIPVVYAGIKPDMFASGRDVIIDGEYRGGSLYAAKLNTQCPSKYEPPKPTGQQSH